MNNRTEQLRPTPETDAAADWFVTLSNDPAKKTVPLEIARKLERERDEAREECKNQHNALLAVMQHAENKIQRLTNERDEVRKDLEFRRELFKIQENYLEQARIERDETILRRLETICAADELQRELSDLFKWVERRSQDGFIDSQTTEQNITRCYDALYDRLDDAIRERDEAREKLKRITFNAQAVVDRWEQPSWKDTEPTAAVIYRLRNALEEK